MWAVQQQGGATLAMTFSTFKRQYWFNIVHYSVVSVQEVTEFHFLQYLPGAV